MRFVLTLAPAICAWAVLCAPAAAQAVSESPVPAIRPDAAGEEIYRAACATCHAADGTGSPSSLVGFALPLANGHGFPDFTDCPTNTVEPTGDWMAVVHSGGRVRALDRHMPAFGDALSDDRSRAWSSTSGRSAANAPGRGETSTFRVACSPRRRSPRTRCCSSPAAGPAAPA